MVILGDSIIIVDFGGKERSKEFIINLEGILKYFWRLGKIYF